MNKCYSATSGRQRRQNVKLWPKLVHYLLRFVFDCREQHPRVWYQPLFYQETRAKTKSLLNYELFTSQKIEYFSLIIILIIIFIVMPGVSLNSKTFSRRWDTTSICLFIEKERRHSGSGCCWFFLAIFSADRNSHHFTVTLLSFFLEASYCRWMCNCCWK